MINRIDHDALALATKLLVAIKGHCRVEHTRDDANLLTYTAASIGLVERKCNVSLDQAEYLVTADELRCSCMPQKVGAARQAWALPLNNVREFTVLDAPGGTDISANFELWQSDFGGNASAYLLGLAGQTMPYAALLTLEVGVVDEADLAPAFFGLVASLTASRYENREASSALWSDNFADELIGLWRPCA